MYDLDEQNRTFSENHACDSTLFLNCTCLDGSLSTTERSKDKEILWLLPPIYIKA
jgi:hypothetical protein